MATCKFCLGRQEGTQFCWKKNKITNIVNGICPEYEHNFTIAIKSSKSDSKSSFWNTFKLRIDKLTPKQREHVKKVLRSEVYGYEVLEAK